MINSIIIRIYSFVFSREDIKIRIISINIYCVTSHKMYNN